MNSERRTCVFVVPDGGRTRVLIVDRDGWRLPAVETDGDWVASSVGPLAEALEVQHGVKGRVLREVPCAEREVCEVELHSLALGSGARMATPAELEALDVAAPDVEVARAVLEDGGHPLRAPWERRGWLEGPTAWIADQARRLGVEVGSLPVPVKGAWPASCVLAVPTSDGPLWFKAVFDKPAPESVVLPALAAVAPGEVPGVVAVDAERRWMLLRPLPEGCPSLDDGPSVVAAFAALQRLVEGDVARWVDLGVPDMRPSAFAERATEVATRRGAHPELTTAVLEVTDELSSSPIPASLVNQDFREGNVAIGARPVFFDWSDVVIGHPFFSFVRYREFAVFDAEGTRDQSDDPRWGALVNAYTAGWAADYGEAVVHRDLALVERLQAVFLACRWDHESRYVEPGTTWSIGLDHMVRRDLERAAREFGLTAG